MSLLRGVTRVTRLPISIILIVAAVQFACASSAAGDDEYSAQREAVEVLLDHSHRVLVGWDVGDGEFARRAKVPAPVDLASHRDRKLQPGDAVVELRCLVGASGGLSDEEASAIIALPMLRKVEIAGVVADAPHGAIDSSLVYIGKLPLLEELYLGTSSVGDEGVRHLKQLRSLRWLSLWNTKVSDAALEHVSAIRYLEGLNLAGTQVTDKGVCHLATLTSLRWLNLAGTNVSGSGLGSLGPLEHLEELVLASSAINDEGAPHLAVLTSLRKLDLSYTKISGAALPALSNMHRLESLDLAYDDMRGEGLRELPRLRELKGLDLAGTRISDTGLVGLRRLESLESVNLEECELSDGGILLLADVPSLKRVTLSGNKRVTVAGVARLRELRPELAIEWTEGSYNPAPR